MNNQTEIELELEVDLLKKLETLSTNQNISIDQIILNIIKEELNLK